jgi:hypothetical protein
MRVMQGPAETTSYMLLGYGVILGIMTLYVASIMARFRKLSREMRMLEEAGEEQKLS